MIRIYRRGGSHPAGWSDFRMFGPTAIGRFDPHLPPPRAQDRGVMYVAQRGPGADALTTALAGCFQASRVIDPIIDEPWLVAWTPERPLVVLDLASAWTTRAGGNQALCAGDRRVARRWARAIYEQLTDLDGLCWPSSVLGIGRSLAMFDRGSSAIPLRPDLHRPLADPALQPAIARAATRIGYSAL